MIFRASSALSPAVLDTCFHGLRLEGHDMIAILDHAAGNLHSVERAFHRIGIVTEVTGDPKRIAQAERIVIPGVGRAGTVMERLRDSGLAEVLRACLCDGKYVLGICIGIQVIFERSEEDDATCLGFLPGRVRSFPDPGKGGTLKVPQMGWNTVRQKRPHPLFDGIPQGSHFYFVNSYYPEPADSDAILGETTYGLPFASAVASGRLVATQFHLEKSGPLGLRMLENFCRWGREDSC